MRLAKVVRCGVVDTTESARLVQFNIDLPLIGMALDPVAVTAAGWSIDVNARLLGIGISNGSKTEPLQLRRHHRPDLSSAAGTANQAGFTATINLRALDFPEKIEFVGTVLGHSKPILLGVLEVQYKELPSVPGRTPLLLNSTARAGTSYLMGLFAAHPNVAVAGPFPYEETVASYFADRYRAATCYDPFECENPALSGSSLGTLDKNQLFALTSDLLASCAANAIFLTESCYSHLSHKSIEEAPVFAEKMMKASHPDEILYSLYDHVFEIILVRDFRDAFVSAMMLNHRRQFLSFGAENAESESEFARGFWQTAQHIMEASQKRPNVPVIKYEQLITSPADVLRKVFSTCGLRCDDVTITQCMQTFDAKDTSNHRTSESGNQSIGRWRAELPQHLVKIANEELREPLDYFGYSHA